MQVEKQLEIIVAALESRKGKEIIVLDVAGKTSVCDYFVVAGGASVPQVKALAEEVELQMDKAGVPKRRAEGISDGRWAVIDYGDIIVHIFHDETRLFYHLERLWSGGDKA